MDMFKKLAVQLKDIKKTQSGVMSLPMGEEFITPKNVFFKIMAEKAVELYEKQSDINKFKALAMSDPENNSHEEIMKNLFKNGVVDPYEDLKFAELSDNKRFLRDLGLL